MERRSNADMKDAQIKLEEEECVEGMERRSNADMKDAQIKLYEEECV